MKWITQLGPISQFGVRQGVVYNVAYNTAIVCIYDDGDNTMTTLTSGKAAGRVLGGKRDKEREREKERETERERWPREKVRGFYRERKDRTVNH